VYFSDEYLTEQLVQRRVDDALHRAEINRWLREAGPQRQGWLSSTGRRFLYPLGRLLEAWGQRLQERYRLQPLSLEEQTA
jgi:hypothetical protein